MKDSNCIFCKIASGEISSRTLYEDEEFRVFLDVNPASIGHVLIIPKEHYKNLYELPDHVSGEILKLARRMACRMKEVLKCEGINLIQNNGEVAGQTVFHFHLHIIPRYTEAENNDILKWNTIQTSEEELDKLENEFKINSN